MLISSIFSLNPLCFLPFPNQNSFLFCRLQILLIWISEKCCLVKELTVSVIITHRAVNVGGWGEGICRSQLLYVFSTCLSICHSVAFFVHPIYQLLWDQFFQTSQVDFRDKFFACLRTVIPFPNNPWFSQP